MSKPHRIVPLTLLLILGTPAAALAWGPATHIFIDYFVLANLKLISTLWAGLIAANSLDFFYGSIAPDIFIGKGSKARNNHCHNWSVGWQVMEQAATPSQQSFACGYLCHLAADVIAHNFYVPSQLYQTITPTRVGHVYWEAGSEAALDKRLTQVASKVISEHHRENDTLLMSVWKQRKFIYQARRQVLKTTLLLANLKSWRRLFQATKKPSTLQPDEKYLRLLQNTSLGAVLHFLKAPKASLVTSYDPVGSHNISLAKTLKKRDLGQHPFLLPDEIYTWRISHQKRAAFNRWLEKRLRQVKHEGMAL